MAQMLEYAANATAYWPVELLQARFEETCRQHGLDPYEELGELLGESADSDEFWQRVKTNLQAGRIRLLFVADHIPETLKSIVEFLNEQMDPAEVLAVEIKQYVSDEHQVLVSRVIGQTSEAITKKRHYLPGRQWDEKSFFEELEKIAGTREAEIFRKILKWSKERDALIKWGKGRIHGSFYPVFERRGVPYQFFGIYTRGKVEISFQTVSSRPPFDSEEKRLELLRRLNEIPGIYLPESGINRWPTFPIGVLTGEVALARFFEAIEWALKIAEEADMQDGGSTGAKNIDNSA